MQGLWDLLFRLSLRGQNEYGTLAFAKGLQKGGCAFTQTPGWTAFISKELLSNPLPSARPTFRIRPESE